MNQQYFKENDIKRMPTPLMSTIRSRGEKVKYVCQTDKIAMICYIFNGVTYIDNCVYLVVDNEAY